MSSLICTFSIRWFIRNDACNRIYQQITISQTILTSKFTAASEIDRVITACLVRARPVYIMLPSDIVKERIPATTLKTPLNLLPPDNEPEIEAYVLDEIVKLVEGVTKGEEKGEVVVLVDVCAVRHHLKKEVEELVRKVRYGGVSAYSYGGQWRHLSVPTDLRWRDQSS